ncbi:putative receptor like protein 25 [Neltuma alba]|uniref:putative receptor like protein 25 n=1 Tax=Neltuma alba TaxID=207710 RepID=UPI0010A3AD82|nr:putative receptor like protein 25 [Prosopis alba]
MENKHNGVSYRESVMVTIKGNEVEPERILTIFTAIDLSNNMFDGEISHVIGELHLLKGLNLSHNKITGPIPQSIANLTYLEWLDLSSNRLTGGIPLALTNLNFFEVLNLSQNQLVGEIPRGKLPQATSSTNDKFGFRWKPMALGYGCGMMFGILMGQVVFSAGKREGFVRIFQGLMVSASFGFGFLVHLGGKSWLCDCMMLVLVL